MKHIAAAAIVATAFSTATAYSGTVEAPRIDPIVIEADAANASSSSAIVQVAMMAILMLGVAVAQ